MSGQFEAGGAEYYASMRRDGADKMIVQVTGPKGTRAWSLPLEGRTRFSSGHMRRGVVWYREDVKNREALAQ